MISVVFSTFGLVIGLIIVVIGFLIGYYYGKWRDELLHDLNINWEDEDD